MRRTGALADSVTDTSPATLAQDRATGFLFEQPDRYQLMAALRRALQLFRDDPRTWQALQRNGMAKDFGWDVSARGCRDLYRSLVPG